MGLQDAFRTAARRVEVAAGQPLLRSGEACRHYLLILDGEARVQTLSKNGGAIALSLAAGQACKLSIACLLAGQV